MTATGAEVVPRPQEPQCTRRFASVLFPPGRDDHTPDEVEQPDYFTDVNLDQIVERVVAGRDQYNLAPIFRVRAGDIDTVMWRQDVFADVEKAEIKKLMVTFANQLNATRKRLALAGKLYSKQQQLRWLLNATDSYLSAIEQFDDSLAAADIGSAALHGLADYVHGYRHGERFQQLAGGARRLLGELGEIRYDLLVRGPKLTVGAYDDEADYSAQVLATFERFRQHDVADHHTEIRSGVEMNSIEAAVLDLVAQLYPDLFARVADFCTAHQDFLDPVIVRADRELQFYLAWLDYVAPLRRAGLTVSRPLVSSDDRHLHAAATFDLALAVKLDAEGKQVVVNDVQLDGAERILVVSGPNQGGKTTLARTFGQLYHLAALGCPVPGEQVRLHLPDAIFAHFEREEHLDSLSGKLEDEVLRVRDILTAATVDSVVVMNEMFSSTTVADAYVLSERVLSTISELDAVCLCVTFIDELSLLDDKTVSMVSTVDEDDPAIRTFKVVRRRADGRAYALAIARKYRLTQDTLLARVEADG